MSSTVTDSRFDTYNAKWLSPNEVARSFVPPPQFAMISKRRNTLIVGPRGSGKTTLLKMLTEAALDEWVKPGEHPSSKTIDYVGVFVATDVSWNYQMTSLGAASLDQECRTRLQFAALTAHTHKALVEAMERHVKRIDAEHLLDSNGLEAQLVTELASNWKLCPNIPSFISLKNALRTRLQSIYEMASLGEKEVISKSEVLSIPLLVSCRNAIEYFNDLYNEPNRFWAFLFDEVELMPTALRDELYAYLRTFPGPIIIKLALSPFDDELHQLESSESAQRDADYDFIPLWYPRKRAAYKFCRELWKAMLRGTHLEGFQADEILGRSLLDTESNEWKPRGTAYTQGSSHYRYLKELADSDVEFRDYLAFHEIQLESIETVKGSTRASTLRKVFPLVVARIEMRRLTDGQAALRSRKVSNLYTGATSIFDISEGNPRRFINLVNRLLERLPEKQNRLDPTIQADEITQAAARYRALLRTIVVPNVSPTVFKKGILSLVDLIGDRLQHLALVAPFSPEPPGTFIVDSHSGVELVRLIGYALNTGAIVHVPDRKGDEQLLSSSRVRGKKFRLSYLLAAHFSIPPRLGRHISMRELFTSDVNSASNDLFFEDENK